MPTHPKRLMHTRRPRKVKKVRRTHRKFLEDDLLLRDLQPQHPLPLLPPLHAPLAAKAAATTTSAQILAPELALFRLPLASLVSLLLAWQSCCLRAFYIRLEVPL